MTGVQTCALPILYVGVRVCTGGAYIVARVCVCRCDSCVCKGVQGSVRVCMHRWCVYCCRGVRVYLHMGASKCEVIGLYCRMDCSLYNQMI